jgi:Fic family protein
MMATSKLTHKNLIINWVRQNPGNSSKEIFDGLALDMAYATLKRLLQDLIAEHLLETTGKGKATKYHISATYELIHPINVEEYFLQDIDDRKIHKDFNHHIIPLTLPKANLFSENELEKLNQLELEYKENIAKLSPEEYKKELERLAIDLSWKSSQIEGNTYSLLETERLLKDKETAAGKTKDEATMLLNHKDAIDFLMDHPQYCTPLTLARIEDIHSLLIKDLMVDRNIRKRRVGITGTNYKPLDNEFQIRESMNAMCELINKEENVFAKALMVLVLISYIQPFNDGNKRTARIISNAILMDNQYCPLSFRTVDSIDYKKAMLIFYEQNNISAFKKIFIDQFEFAVKTYF